MIGLRGCEGQDSEMRLLGDSANCESFLRFGRICMTCVSVKFCEVGPDFPGELVFGLGFWKSGVFELRLLGSSDFEEKVLGLFIERKIK